jgi:hypothetical protein
MTTCPIGKKKNGINTGINNNNLLENNNVWIGLFNVVEFFFIYQGL